MDRQYFGRNFDKFRQLFIIFSTNYPDNLCDWKIGPLPGKFGGGERREKVETRKFCFIDFDLQRSWSHSCFRPTQSFVLLGKCRLCWVPKSEVVEMGASLPCESLIASFSFRCLWIVTSPPHFNYWTIIPRRTATKRGGGMIKGGSLSCAIPETIVIKLLGEIVPVDF